MLLLHLGIFVVYFVYNKISTRQPDMKVDANPKEEKEFYHQKIRSLEKTKSFIRFVVITTILWIGLMLSIVYINSSEESAFSYTNMTPESKMEQYHDLILTGDQSLSEGNYHEAASKYRNALQFMPKDSIATLRLISASDLDCITNDENCGESDKLLADYVEF